MRTIMKSVTKFSRIIYVVLSFTALLLTGCGGGGDSTPAPFTVGKVLGKTFVYSSSTGTIGTLAFNTDKTWSTTIDDSTFSGTWSINEVGKLVCVTTTGGNQTLTYTLLTDAANALATSVVEVNPADPANPSSYTATLTPVITSNQVSGKTFFYASSTGSTGKLALNVDNTWSTTIGTSIFGGTWSISNGKLVCVTTFGGNYTLTYTALVSVDANAIHASVLEVHPADPANPVNYTATLTALYTITGKVSKSNAGWAGVTVNLDGDQTQIVTADADGNYRFTVTAGEYRVTPANQSAIFTPLDAVLDVRNADVSAVDFVLAPIMAGPTAKTWKQTGSLSYKRAGQTATLLQNGKVLVVGGTNDWGTRGSAEIYDPATGRWTQTGSLNHAREDHTATLLQNGKLLVVGGRSSVLASYGQTHATAEIYDPATGKWTQTGSLAYDRSSHTATLLPNGKVLVTGGKDNISTGASAEIYDPATGKWTQTGSLNDARYNQTATLLQNGEVLVTGGRTGSIVYYATSEIYDPATGKWTQTGSLNHARNYHTATLLQNGKVLVAAGVGDASFNSAEIYDPATGKWIETGSLNHTRYNQTATLLQNGKLLVTGGSHTILNPFASAEIYDPATGAWTQTGSLHTGRDSHTATLLQNGMVLVAGGIYGQVLGSAELFYPGP